MNAFVEISRHKVPRTSRLCRLEKQLAIRADRLESMVLDHYRLPQQFPEYHRYHHRAGKMNNVGFAKQSEQRNQAGTSYDTKW